MGFLSSSLLDFLCPVSVSASPARSPVFSHLASSLRGLWTIRACKTEQKFQELFDAHQDLHSGLYVSGDDFKGYDVLPSEPDSISGGLAGPHLSLCCPTYPSAHLPPPLLPSASPLCSLLPCHPQLSSPHWFALSLCHCALWTSVSLGQASANFFFVKIQIENIVGLCAILCLL